MIIIAHRGNTNGPQPSLENDPRYLQEAIDKGYSVEVDVWLWGGNFMLGHDTPQYYPVNDQFLLSSKVWCHAKNIEGLLALQNMRANCFWHETDKYTLTSHGYVWTYPGCEIAYQVKSTQIIVDINAKTHSVFRPKPAGICTDYAGCFMIDQ